MRDTSSSLAKVSACTRARIGSPIPFGAVIALCVLAALCGCTTYTPVPLTPALQQQNVRIRLTQQGTADVGSTLGGGASELQGRILTANDSAVTISVMQVTRLTGVDETWNGEQATIALRDISEVAREQRSVARSVAAAGILGGGAYLIGRSFGGGNVTGTHNTSGGSVK
ncbi:MAG: hypothetical protein ABI194_06760 [Gemmatimonadaceae bacterium]